MRTLNNAYIFLNNILKIPASIQPSIYLTNDAMVQVELRISNQ